MKIAHATVFAVLLACGRIALSAGTPATQAGRVPFASSAVDLKGIRHHPGDGSSKGWMPIKKGLIEYPLDARRSKIQGRGLFRLTLDVATGSVRKVTIIYSTGTRSLDQSAVNGLRQCQWKPGEWKEIDIPIKFTLRF